MVVHLAGEQNVQVIFWPFHKGSLLPMPKIENGASFPCKWLNHRPLKSKKRNFFQKFRFLLLRGR